MLRLIEGAVRFTAGATSPTPGVTTGRPDILTTMPVSPDPATLVATRTALHTAAEHLLAGPQYRATGRIGLHPAPGGFATTTFRQGDRALRLALVADQLVVTDDGEDRTAPLRGIGEAADFAGVRAGGPSEVYALETPLDPAASLRIDRPSAEHIARLFAVTADALDEFTTAHAAEDPSDPVLWPEHFDLAISMNEVNYGASPGDDGSDMPYLYVGPWAPRVGQFWTQPFGAVRAWDPSMTATDVAAFFAEGRERAAADPLG